MWYTKNGTKKRKREEDKMEHIKDSFKMIRYNLKTLVGFEFFFKLLSVLLCPPLFVHLFDFIMKVRGFPYLTLENMISFFIHPYTIILLLFLFLIISIYTLFDITTIIVILDCSYQEKKINITNAIRISLEKCKNIVHFKNIGFTILILFLIPFLNVGVSSSFFSRIMIPEFIQEYISKNQTLVILCMFLFSFFCVLFLRLLYTIHYYILENANFKVARKRSHVLGHKHHLKDLITLAIVQLTLFICFIFYIALGLFLIIKIQDILGNVLLKSFLTTILFGFVAISFLIFTLLSAPISYAGISSLYYVRKKELGEKGSHISITMTEKNTKTNKHLKRIFRGITIVSLGIGTMFTYGVYKGKYDINIEYTRKIEITAHRGASSLYPENTMAAFRGAKELGADVIELDVQQTKDKEIIVIHDKNLKRTTGVDKNVWEVTKEERQNLDAGSFLKNEFIGEKIPLLKEVVDWAKENDMKLNIELKPTGKEENFEASVIEIIKNANYIENVVIASQVYQVLENVKHMDETIKTVYVASLFYGDIHAFPAADDFSLETSNITKGLVNRIHEEGKEIYAWTINTKENMEKVIELNVDNIITDDIELAKKSIILNRKSNLIYEYVKWIETHF